jgi:HAD superfamily hydrolase (TIGR01484 family)
MKYKALFLDVDGTTVLHSIRSLPSPKVTQAIARCAKMGVAVCLATSRPLEFALPVIEHLSLSGLCVIGAGLQIYDPQKKKIIKETFLQKNTIPAIYAVARAIHKKVGIYGGVKEHAYRGGKIPNRVYSLFFSKINPQDSLNVVKLLEKIPGVAVHRMSSWFKGFDWIDIQDASATKLHGIVEVGKLLGIQTHEMIGVGDGYNDFPLLMACGLKIAMGNAVPELKAIADFIAPSVEEDGVATVIEKFILNT